MGIKLCSIASGSSGNCIYVGSEEAGILVDCGVSGKEILTGLKNIGVCNSTIKGILVTHEHSDHTRGLGIISRKLDIPIYANAKTWSQIDGSIGSIKAENIRLFNTDETFSIANMDIKSYSIPHDAEDPVGFCFNAGGKKVCIATDLGHFSANVRENIKGADMVLLESNHDENMLKVGRYPYFLKRRILGENGHLSNDAAGRAVYDLLCTGVKEVLLGHLSRENNFPELAYQTVKNILEEKQVKVGEDIQINLAPRCSLSKCYSIE